MSQVRLSLAIGGFVLALFSVALNQIGLGWGAIALLTVSLVLRLIQRKRGSGNPGADR